ncbi:S8 family peptidase [Streptomyces sp. SM12]|uniref:S8 family peptidase n=1 Tax=Streptomyces sp. SM12 TaxID=1071602 RepID=UPI000CD59860|nr:S8 family peptidase [Streptomyces sp. SM12]
MRRSRTGAAVIATAVALALTAGLGGATAAPQEEKEPAPSSQTFGEGRTVTLITGDRVSVGPDGRATGLVPAEGREHIPVRVTHHDGSTQVVPRDAAALIAEGSLDARLFDLGELTRPEYDTFDGTPLIVTYDDGTSSARDTLHAEAEPEVRAEFDVLNAEALTLPEKSADSAWAALTAANDEAAASLTAAPGVTRITLDGFRQAMLDTSVPLVGAPDAWDAGYDGTGVTIAVLDTGMDADHGDFDGKITAARNFTDAPDTDDPYGHGTHVASIAAGTGDRSDGTYRGVAPGAELVNAKVLNDDGGGMESWIIAGMEWAIDEGSQIVNMSLGGWAGTEIDPMEEAVDQLSADTGALFVVAAGNSGPGERTIDSPGSADAALTVGSTTKSDEISDFSGVGPRLRGGVLKPDMAAPGQDIGAAAAAGSIIERDGDPVADGYVSISGTSMATPHVAGAAAILLQKNPDWTGEQLKSVLVSSALGLDGYAPVQQGTGRLDLVRALDQSVTADSNALTFGVVEYPHEDAEPVSREITYRNSADEDVTLALATETTTPDGSAAPEGTFTLSAEELTVPAGSSATVEVTASTRDGGELYGSYGVFVTATSEDGQRVRTAGTLDREAQMHEVTVDVTGRDGEPPTAVDVWFQNISTGDFHMLGTTDGRLTARLPEGTYLTEVNALNGDLDEGELSGIDWAVLPALEIPETPSLSVDLRDAGEIDFTVPDDGTELDFLHGGFQADWGTGEADVAWMFGAPTGGVRTLELGEAPADWEFSSAFGSLHGMGGDMERHGYRGVEDGFPTGLVNHPSEEDFSTLSIDLGAPASDAIGALVPYPPTGVALGAFRDLPATFELRLQTDASTDWFLLMDQTDFAGDWFATYYSTTESDYQPGQSYHHTFNVGVFGPSFAHDGGIYRDGAYLYAMFGLFNDGADNGGFAEFEEARTELYRDGELLKRTSDPANWLDTEVPEEEAEYRLVSTTERGGLGYTDVSTGVSVDYTFTSAATEEPTRVSGPAAVRFTPKLALDSTGPAGRKQVVPVTVEGTEEKSLKIEISYDGGETWTKTRVLPGSVTKVLADNPAAGGSVSFRATVKDNDGNTTVQTVIDAYRTK